MAAGVVALGAVSGSSALGVLSASEAISLSAARTITSRLRARLLADARVASRRWWGRALGHSAARLSTVSNGANISGFATGVVTASSAVRLLAVAASAASHITLGVAQEGVQASGRGASVSIAIAISSTVLHSASLAGLARGV